MGGSRRLLAMAFTLLMVGARARAQVIYDNGAPNGVTGNEMTAQVQAADFTLATKAKVTGIRFWGGEANNLSYSGEIFWKIASNAGGVPDGILASGSATPTRTYDNTTLVDWYTFQLGVSPVTLAANTYWLELHNGPYTNTTSSGFFWESTAPNATLHDKEDAAPFDGTWTDTPDTKEHAFQILGRQVSSTPEPVGLILMATGLAGVAAARWRKRKSPSA